MRPITVVIPTYNRHEILTSTVSGLQGFLRYHIGEIKILISDDSDDKAHLYANLELPDIFHNTRVITGPGKGLGANLNFLLSEVDTDIVLQMDHDHVLSRPLDITQYVKDLRGNPDQRQRIGWIRLMLGEEKDVESIDTYYKFIGHLQGRYWFLVAGGELYIASNRPHLKRVDFHDVDNYGPYSENIKLGQTEADFCRRYQDIHKNSWSLGIPPYYVVIPMCAPPFGTWKHVGESWQHTKADK